MMPPTSLLVVLRGPEEGRRTISGGLVGNYSSHVAIRMQLLSGCLLWRASP